MNKRTHRALNMQIQSAQVEQDILYDTQQITSGPGLDPTFFTMSLPTRTILPWPLDLMDERHVAMASLPEAIVKALTYAQTTGAQMLPESVRCPSCGGEHNNVEVLVLCLSCNERFETPAVWTTEKGQKKPIKDMDDQHLLNTIRMVTTGRAAGGRTVARLAPDNWLRLKMEHEAARRGLKLPEPLP